MLSGSLPNAFEFTITAGLVFLISDPMVGSRLINQISLRFIKPIQVYSCKSS